ncbi:MAG TPA: site-2 protease family protein [Methylomirabilota bacterium]|jgi:Zn-dependent protease|nr:site-2 protease family protein [Methylomirabilota bacterium]
MTSITGVADVRLARLDRPTWLVSGVPVVIAPSWLLGVALTAWTAADALLPDAVPGRSGVAYALTALAAAAGVAMTVALHETAHCAAALRAGLGVRRVTLGFLGGALELADMPATPAVELRITLAGPLATAGAAIVATLLHVLLVVAEVDPLLAAAAAVVAFANVLITVVNCAPALPLDGGHVVRAALWALSRRNGAATRLPRGAGRVLAVTLAALALLASASGSVALALWLALLGLSLSAA